MQRIEIRAAAQPVFRNKPQLIITMSTVVVLNATEEQMPIEMMQRIEICAPAQPVSRRKPQLIITLSTVTVLNTNEKRMLVSALCSRRLKPNSSIAVAAALRTPRALVVMVVIVRTSATRVIAMARATVVVWVATQATRTNVIQLL